MPIKRTTARRRVLKPWERAFLENDESHCITPRDHARFRLMKRNPDGWLMLGDRTARELTEDFDHA